MHALHRSTAFLAAAVLFVSSFSYGAEPLEMRLALRDAVFRGERVPESEVDRFSLILELQRRADRWAHVVGVARNFNASVHAGHVADSSVEDETIRLTLRMRLGSDSWSPGGLARYEVSLARSADGRLSGEYAGQLRGEAVEGAAEGRVHPPRARIQGLQPAAPGEHPRLLLRRSDIDPLKQRAGTAFGKAAMEKLAGREDDAIALALRYALTGEDELARRAIPSIQERMKRGALSDQYGHNLGVRLEAAAIAYDLCREVWPRQFREKVEAYLFWGGQAMLHHQGVFGGGINWQADSNWAAPNYMGLGYAGLALWGEPGPKPPKPRPTRAGASIRAADGYEPGDGVPVHTFQDREMPDDWLYAGPFQPEGASGPLAGLTGLHITFEGDVRAPLDEEDGPLAELGGPERARPERGTEVRFGGKTITFETLSHEKDRGYWRGEIDVTNAAGRRLFSRNFFYCVIRNDEPRWVRIGLGLGNARMYLAGTRLRDGDSAHLEPGLYPVLVAVPILWMNPWGRHLMSPCLTEISAAEAHRIARRERRAHEQRLAQWRLDADLWKRTDGQRVDYLKLARAGWLMNYLHYRGAMGTGGFQAELAHYSNIASGEAARYAPAYRRVFAREVSHYDDVSHFLPRKMFAHVYPGKGPPQAEEINGKPEITPGMFPALYPLVPNRWKRAVLWGWGRHRAGSPDAPPERLLKDAPVHTFLHYPLGVTPEHPRRSLPLTWRAPTLGYYAFRNAWSGTDDFVTQVFLKAHSINGWNSGNAGTFRLRGLGHVWAYGPVDRNRVRWEENVVLLPEDPGLFTSGLGRATHVSTWKDGSGVVSVDLSDLYARTKDGVDAYSDYGGLRNPEAFIDSGITGMRSIGIDYSGKSGAPCLLVLVDRIEGGGKKVWTWQLATSTESGTGALPQTSVDGRSFAIDKPDGATLRGTFIAPRAVKVTAEKRHHTMTGRAGSPAGKELDRPISGVFAEGGDRYFVVVTVQRGNAPGIRVDGEGLDAKVRIGEQTVRFDGERVHFGDD